MKLKFLICANCGFHIPLMKFQHYCPKCDIIIHSKYDLEMIEKEVKK